MLGMRKLLVVLVISAITFILAACSTGLTTVTSSSASAIQSTVLPSQVVVPTPTPAPVATASLTTEGSIDWATYVFTEGVSIEYPSGWIVVPSEHGFVVFRDPVGERSIRLEVYKRPIEERAICNPHSWEANEGGYTIHWEKTISIGSAEGLEFIWGAALGGQWDTVPSLQVIYYSEQHDLDIRLSTDFDVRYLEFTQSPRPADLISARFDIFEHMAQSIRISR